MKRILVYSAVALSLIMASFTIDNNVSISSIKDTKYNNLIQINVKFNNVDTLLVSLVDPIGNVLYQETLVGDYYKRKFSLDVTDSDLADTLTLVIKPKHSKEVKYKFIPSEVLSK